MNIYNWTGDELKFTMEWINTLLNLYFIKKEEERNEKLKQQCFIIPDIGIGL